MNQKKKTPVLVRQIGEKIFLIDLDEPTKEMFTFLSWSKEDGFKIVTEKEVKESIPHIDTPEAAEIIKDYEYRFGYECKNVKKFEITYKLHNKLWGYNHFLFDYEK